MIGRKISHYKILEKISDGGTGDVYKAKDIKLKRLVALKFLRSLAFDSAEQQLRFIKEAQTAAAMDHPNICTIYEIGEKKKQIFLSMAYIKGISLKERIQSGPLELNEALNIAIQMAEGLEAAHNKGVVHRNINSSNILVTNDGQVKIMDFGLALKTSTKQDSKTDTTAGTVVYMSPEQARGEATDQRTDIWSWGVCLYEMLTGLLPFKGAYDAAIFYSILNENPVPISKLCSNIPHKVTEITEKSMEKDIEKRYQTFSEILSQLRTPVKAFNIESSKAPPAVTPSQPSIAVLPFTDMSPKKDQEYFCDGITEEIINALSYIDELRVASRTSTFVFKGRNQDIREIGRILNVSTLLEGSVRKSGNRLRITAQLINVADGYHIWTGQYDRELEDVFAIQEEVAQSIVQALKVELSDDEKRALEKTATKDVKAYEFYLRGRKYFYMARRKCIGYACDMFSRAIKRDPNYALAYAGLADCYSFLYMHQDSKQENLERSVAASRKALELAPDLAEAHVSYGLAVSLSKNFDEADREFEKAIQLNPKLFEAYYFYARDCYTQGKLEKAARLYEHACRVNPEDYQAPILLAQTYRGLKLNEKVEGTLHRGVENAKKHLEMNPDDARALYMGATCLIELGQREEGMDWMKKALEIDPDDPVTLYAIACAHSLMGNIDEAIDNLDKALAAGFIHKKWMEQDSDLDAIRKDPRFTTLIKKLE